MLVKKGAGCDIGSDDEAIPSEPSRNSPTRQRWLYVNSMDSEGSTEYFVDHVLVNHVWLLDAMESMIFDFIVLVNNARATLGQLDEAKGGLYDHI